MARPDERLTAVTPYLDPADDGGLGHRIGAVEDTRGRITDIYADNTGDGLVTLADSHIIMTLDLDGAIELATFLGLAIARARDPR